MNIGIISARYAKALYSYACKMGVEDEGACAKLWSILPSAGAVV